MNNFLGGTPNPEKKIYPIAKTISQFFKASRTYLILKQQPHLCLGDTLLRYHKKIRPLIAFFIADTTSLPDI